jgi:hypothetical protein
VEVEMANNILSLETELNDFALCKFCQLTFDENTLLDNVCYQCRNQDGHSLEDEETEIAEKNPNQKNDNLYNFDDVNNKNLHPFCQALEKEFLSAARNSLNHVFKQK